MTIRYLDPKGLKVMGMPSPCVIDEQGGGVFFS